MTTVYWREASQVERPTPAPTLPDRVDVAVIGAGFAGLSIALDLVAAGRQVALLDARYPGFGASGRNAGALLPLAVFPWLLPGSAGAHDPRESQRLLHARISAHIECLAQDHPDAEVRPVRMLLIASNRLVEAGLRWVGDTVSAAGIDVEDWSGADITSTCGARATAGISLRSWTVQPAALASSLAARFVAAGGSLHENAPVSAVVPAKDGVVLRLGSGSLHADRVVVSTGAYTGGIELPDAPSAEVVHTYMRGSAPLPEDAGLGGEDLFLSAPGLGMAYWRTHRGRLLFGGTDVSGLSPGDDADALPSAHHAVDRLMHRRLPAAPASSPAHRWGGAMHVTSTEIPHLSRSALSDRIVYAVGFAGSGVALALSAGPLVRDLVLGPAAADPEAVHLRTAMHATTVPWRGLLGTVRPAAAHLLRSLTRHR